MPAGMALAFAECRMPSTATVISAPSDNRGYVSAIASSEEALYVVGGIHSGMLLVSSDGVNFHPRAEFRGGIRSVHVVGARVFVSGQRGYLAYSDDEGKTWTDIEHEQSGCIYRFAQVEGTLLASADGGVLHRIALDTLAASTVETGATERQVCVKNTTHGLFLLDASGVIRRARQLGDAFEVVHRGRAAFACLAETAAGTLLVSGDQGQLVRSTDGGNTFTPIEHGVREDIEGVGVFGERVLAWGGGGLLMRSTDDGLTFKPIELPKAAKRKTMWAAHMLRGALLVGGDDGLVMTLDPIPEAWSERTDRFLPDYPLAAVFEGGPDGFVGPRLRAYVAHVNGFDPVQEPPQALPVRDEDEDEGDAGEPDTSEFQGEDAWKAEAIARLDGLWSGDSDDFEEVWGISPPADLQAFEQAVAGADMWSTFNEFRLDCAQMAAPADDEANMFEQLILNDQLNYLGTALPEAFSGLAGIGSLGNGDTYHLSVPGISDAPKAQVVFYDHEEHCFSEDFADSLDSLAYLCALTWAQDDEALPAEATQTGYEALHERVKPSWHFSMDERDEDFEDYESEDDMHRFCFWRARWLITLFRHDHGGDPADVGESFTANLNTVVSDEMAVQRAEVAKKLAPTAMYAAWRAYIFEEPRLDLYLSACRGHKSRLARDAGRLIEELRGGRTTIGRILDWPAKLAAVRALDLDPRRAEGREEEASARRAELEARAAEITETMNALDGKALEVFCREHTGDPSVRRALMAALLDRPNLAEAKRAATFLAEDGYSRNNSLYRDEQHGACRYLADNADGALQLLLVGESINPSETPDSDDNDAEKPFPVFGFAELEQMLLRWQHTGALRPESTALIRASLLDDEGDKPWRITAFINLLTRAADTESADAFASRLQEIPTEGGFETRLQHDDRGRDLATALGRLGSQQHAEVLIPLAKSKTLRHTPVGAVLALARLDPGRVDDTIFAQTLQRTVEVNDHAETSRGLLAYALFAQHQPKDRHAALLSQLEACESMASHYPDVKLARAYAAYTLTGRADRTPVVEALRATLAHAGYEPISSHRFVLEFLRDCPTFGRDIVDALPSLLTANDAVFRDDVCALLKSLGAETTAPTADLHWLSVEGISIDEALACLADDSRQGRHWLVLRLANEHTEGVRSALENAMSRVLDRAPEKPAADLPGLDGRLLKEVSLAFQAQDHVPLALYDRALRHPNREVKGPVLLNPPPEPKLADAMRVVAAEKYGWQESTAREWLEEHS
ncbi:MAG: hypothetical protein KUG77_15560 [Nannocystaceae bacterium]|nr:hypothetical protein [Nannocystaceae bacterium]